MIRIIWTGKDETVAYAAKEFKKYLDKVSGTLGYGQLCPVDVLPKKAGKNEVLLGLLSELGLDDSIVDDPDLDDLEDVLVENDSGYIAGSNPRSILFGVYDYFKSAGCRWVRPGVLGEHLVKFNPAEHRFVYRKMADMPFRGECLEGAVKYEHIRAAVEWAPKVHMNLFMIQGIVPYNFMKHWYCHTFNTVRPDEDIGYDGVKELIALVESDIRRCGLQLHALGHAYQTEAYGIHYITSHSQYEMNSRMENALALVNGKRAFRGSPSWSQLCMGNDEVLRDTVNWLAGYAESKPQINFLHVWLGDGANNHCECPLCTPHHPSDLYIKMLNMLDEELTRRGVKTRIVFISYVDTLWTPLKEHLNHPERFILCTAVGGRNYSEPYENREYEGELPKWERNHFNVPSDFALRRKMFLAWKKIYSGPNFAFEYHFYTDHYNDPGTMSVAKNFYCDLHQLGNLQFNGMMNCQTQRIAFPSALPVMLTGEALFDLSRSYESFECDYFAGSFGEKWEDVRDYLNEITRLFNPKILRQVLSIDADSVNDKETVKKPAWMDNPAVAADLAEIPGTVDRFMPTVHENLSLDDRCQAHSWKLLLFHGEYCKRLGEVLRQGAIGDIPSAEMKLNEMIDWLSHVEPEIEYEFDLRLFTQCFTRKLK